MPQLELSWPMFVLYLFAGLIALCAELINLMFCGFFFFTVIGFVNVLLLFSLSLYGLSVNRTNDKILGWLSAFILSFGYIITTLSAISLACTVDPTADICLVSITRSRLITENCMTAFASVQNFFFPNRNVGSLHSIVHCILLAVGFLEILLSLVILVWIRQSVCYKLRCYHIQILTGLLLIGPAVMHVLYCSVYFYLGLGCWLVVFAVATGLVGYCKSRTQPVYDSVGFLFFNVMLVACGLITVGLGGFGLVCWSLRYNGKVDSYRQHCDRAASLGQGHLQLYDNCFERLGDTFYSQFPPHNSVVAGDIVKLQLCSYCGLVILALVLVTTGFYAVCKSLRSRRKLN